MKITLGLDSSDRTEDIPAYVKEGADEFFAGFVPPEWYNRYGWEISLNRRENGPQTQFTQYRGLERIIAAVHRQGKEIFIAFNAHQYCGEQLPLLRGIISAVEKFNPDGYLVADPALMIMLRLWGIKRPLHLSTGSACYNSESIRYFSNRIGINRVILPRKMSLKEIEELIKSLGDSKIEFEAMIILYRCFFNDEYCFSWHSGANPSLCYYFNRVQKYVKSTFPPQWKKTLEKILQNPQSQFEEASILDRFLKEASAEPKEIEKKLCSLQIEGKIKQTTGMHQSLASAMFKNCGLCAIAQLKKAGVSVLKIPARGKRGMKIKYIQAVRQAVEHAAPAQEFCRGIINSPGFCSEAGSCYYYLEG